MTNIARNFSQYLIHLLLITVLLTLANVTLKSFQKPIILVSKQQSAYNLEPAIVDFFSLGYKRFIVAIVWISTIIESDHEHYRLKDSNSWMFLRFNLISTLDPKFYENYVFGGQYLSIIKDDDIGARIIFEKGLLNYPNSYDLLLHASFHFMFELNDKEKAIPIYRKLLNFEKTPKQIKSIYARIIATQGNSDEAFIIVKELYEQNKHIEFFEKRYLSILYSIKAEKDLACLNSHKKQCDRYDLEGKLYINQGNGFSAQKKWTPFRYHK